MKRNLLFGQKIKVVKQYLTTGTEHAELIGNKIIVYLYPSDLEVQKYKLILEPFFDVQLKDYLADRIKYFCDLYNEPKTEFNISYKQPDYVLALYNYSMWSRCARTILFNRKLVQCHKDSIDALIVGMLCRLNALKDEEAYKLLLAERMPDYQEKIRKIKL